MTIPAGHRFEATQALRQVLSRAVDWKMIDVNPAKHGVDNPQRRRTEKRPFESWAQLAKVASRLGDRERALVIFAAATGLRPGEWIALEQRDIDREARVVYVRRAYRNGRRPKPACVPYRCRRARWQRSSNCPPIKAARFCFPLLAAGTSICTTSATATGNPPNALPGSRRCGGSTIY